MEAANCYRYSFFLTENLENTRDLSNNNLFGEVPEFLGNMKSLVFM